MYARLFSFTPQEPIITYVATFLGTELYIVTRIYPCLLLLFWGVNSGFPLNTFWGYFYDGLPSSKHITTVNMPVGFPIAMSRCIFPDITAIHQIPPRSSDPVDSASGPARCVAAPPIYATAAALLPRPGPESPRCVLTGAAHGTPHFPTSVGRVPWGRHRTSRRPGFSSAPRLARGLGCVLAAWRRE